MKGKSNILSFCFATVLIAISIFACNTTPTTDYNFDSQALTAQLASVKPTSEVESFIVRDVFVAGGNRELLGHGVYMDEIGIKQLYEVSKGRKIKSYITHAQRDRTLEEVGYFDNIRLIDDKLIADFHFFKSVIKHQPHVVDKLMEMVSVMPEEFGISIVVGTNLVNVFKDGTESPWDPRVLVNPEMLKHKNPVLRPDKVVSFDWVTSGALTPEGVFVPVK